MRLNCCAQIEARVAVARDCWRRRARIAGVPQAGLVVVEYCLCLAGWVFEVSIRHQAPTPSELPGAAHRDHPVEENADCGQSARVGGQSIEHGLGSLLEVSAQRADVQLLPCRRRCCRSLSGSGRSRSGRPGSLSRRHRAAKKRQLSEPRTRSGSKCLTSGTGHPYGQVRVVRCGHARASFQAAQSPYEAITNRPGWCVRN